jgi:hypothetical protein
LKGFEGDLIATLVLAVFTCLFLDCIVGEVDVFIRAVLEAKFIAGGAYVASGIEIS